MRRAKTIKVMVWLLVMLGLALIATPSTLVLKSKAKLAGLPTMTLSFAPDGDSAISVNAVVVNDTSRPLVLDSSRLRVQMSMASFERKYPNVEFYVLKSDEKNARLSIIEPGKSSIIRGHISPQNRISLKHLGENFPDESVDALQESNFPTTVEKFRNMRLTLCYIERASVSSLSWKFECVPTK
jgi:hypothetical protein